MSPTPGPWDPASTTLVLLLAQTARGPRRDGVFALWLTVRVAQDLMLEPPVADRAQRRRVAALEQRITSLTLSAPLRRALTTALTQLRDGRAETMPIIMTQLVAPARDSLGPQAAEAVALAVRASREKQRTGQEPVREGNRRAGLSRDRV